MKGYSCWLQNGFHPVNGLATTHEYKSYYKDLKDCLTPEFRLICKVIHEGCQADASAAEKFDNWSHHEGRYSGGTFETKW